MKKLIYLVLSVLCGISGIYGIYDTITTPKYDLATSIKRRMRLNHRRKPPQTLQQWKRYQSLMPTRMMAWRTITWPSTSRPQD